MILEKVVDFASTDTRWKDGKHLDFDKIKGWGATRAIFRCTFGLEFIDPEYEYNVANSVRVGLPFSSYHLFKPEVPAIDQLEYFLANSYRTPEQDAFDFEIYGRYQTAQTLAWLGGYNRIVGKKPLLYGNLGGMASLGEATRLQKLADLWLSFPSAGPVAPAVKNWPKVKGWQYTFKAIVPGVPDAGVDVSRFYE